MPGFPMPFTASGSRTTLTLAADMNIKGSITADAMTAAVLNIPGASVIDLGSDQYKSAFAGNIGYQMITPGSLDIFGAGSRVGSRSIKAWDNVLIPGTLTSHSCNLDSLKVSGSTSLTKTDRMVICVIP